jgi:YtxH-like protein
MRRKDRQRERDKASAGPEDQRRMRDIALLIAGIGIGSGVALLLAPDSGEEVRRTIGRGYRKTIKNIGRHSEDLLDRAEDLLAHAHDLRERGSKLLHFGRGRETVRREA